MEINYCLQEVGECFALLCQAGGGGSMGVKHTEAWTDHSDRLIGSLHDTLHKLYADMTLGQYISH